MNKSNEPVIRGRAEHCISRRDIDPDALKVLYRLARHHHTAYLVGGGVRDLLLQRKPKDFDLSTSANPNEIKRLFRNCFLIGRRFRLAHIKYGEKIIETSTFRALPKHQDPDDPEADLFQRDDNAFGTPMEDALRRDFTINGLFYDIENFSVIDYVGGLEDLEEKVIRCIGDPDIRFREDPVRMLRAVRFASRLGFTIEKNTLSAIQKHYKEIEKASPPRLLEEIYRLFAFQSGEAAFRLLRETRLMEIIFPDVDNYLDEVGEGNAPLWKYLAALDRGDTVVAENTPALMFGSLYYDIYLHHLKKENGGGIVHTKTVRDFLDPIGQRLIMPRRAKDTLARMLMAQQRFLAKRKRRFSKMRFVGQESFPESLALCEIHLTATGDDLSILQPWRDAYEDYIEKLDGIGQDENKKSQGRDRTRRKRRSDRSSRPNTEEQTETLPEIKQDKEEGTAEKSTKKKRRRRRKKTSSAPAAENQTQAQQESKPSLRVADDDIDVSAPISGGSFYTNMKKDSKPKDKSEEKPHRKQEKAQPKKDTAPDFEPEAPHWMDEI
ncbi:MAG: polynucleotide adenylyltransferase PcnB [Planctomycetes bacterium]|nr:polynucleotide adenylyltransferase PcnB [Planctomycetota bacterium]